ncbi:hypothetical protein N4G58_11205 [Edwardsiella piscicida]|nr:hypothetical protein N4G58_11205 [Edwardsiella piscicida]
MVEKDFGILSIKSGLSRNITLNEMPGITLTDNWRARHYNAERADRYTASVGLDGRVTEKLHVQLTLNSSFDGDFKTDGEGGWEYAIASDIWSLYPWLCHLLILICLIQYQNQVD